MKRFIPYILSLSAVIAASCVKEDPNGIIQPDPEVTPKPDPKPEQQAAVSFSSIMQEEISSTRTGANTRAQEGLKKDFVVYGYKMTDNSSPIVFDGYNVTYNANSSGTSEDNSHNYSYVNETQTIKYWDFSATEYRFWGYTGDKGNFTSNGNGMELIIPVSSLLEADEPTSLPYFSTLYIRKPVSSDVVTLEFKRPYSKVRVLFYTSEPLVGDDKIELSDITFAPNEKKIYKAGSLKLTYSLSEVQTTETFVADPSSESTDSQDKFIYKPLTLNLSDGSALNNAVLAKTTLSTDGTEFYYTLPMGDKNPAFTMSVVIDGDTAEPKTAVIPATFMNWKPNYIYTYIFKITEAGKKIEFYDVMIDPWKYGGSQEEEWKNW